MIGRIIFGLIDAGFAVAQGIDKGWDIAQRIGRRLLPRRREDTRPLPHRDAERQAEFARRAGHEQEPR